MREIEASRSATLRQLAHDLKNPLTAVQVLADMLREDVGSSLVGDVEDLLEALDVAVVMADGLSDLARFESDHVFPMMVASTDLELLARRVGARPAFRKLVDVRVGSGLGVVDPDLATRILGSVFVNGRRMVTGSRLRVRVEGATIQVDHPGVTLDAVQVEALLSPYGGATLRAKRVRASALGLGCAAAAMKRCDGRLDVSMEPDGMRVSLGFRAP